MINDLYIYNMKHCGFVIKFNFQTYLQKNRSNSITEQNYEV